MLPNKSSAKTKTIMALSALVGILSASLASSPAFAAASKPMPYHFDSWAAIAIILTSVAVAVFVNHQKATYRVFGTLLAALGAFAVSLWFGWAYFYSGIVANPKPIVIPIDAIKPSIIAIQAVLSVVATIALGWATYWQSKRTDALNLPYDNGSAGAGEGYGLVSRYFHWVIGILILILIPMGIFASMIPEDVWYRRGYYVAHKSIGFIVLLLAIARIVWHIKNKRPTIVAALKRWEKGLAHSAHFLLYFFMIVFPLSGFIMSTFGAKPSFLFFWEAPLLWQPNEQGVLIFGLTHKVILPYLFYIVFGAHILGALKHHFLDKKSSLNRIVS